MAITRDHESPTGPGRTAATNYGVVVHTLGRADGDGITMLVVEASNALAAEHAAVEIAEARFGCAAVAEHAVPYPNLPATAPATDTSPPR